MNKVILKIDGMMCGMCEAHVADAIRRVCGKKAKVSASHTQGTAEILLEEQPDLARIKSAVKETGYKVLDVRVEPCEKRRFSLFKH
ncbi:MAG: cation transporter [Clostridiales bacterium]|nr:cation transporter [Clostridiales bacterium]